MPLLFCVSLQLIRWFLFAAADLLRESVSYKSSEIQANQVIGRSDLDYQLFLAQEIQCLLQKSLSTLEMNGHFWNLFKASTFAIELIYALLQNGQGNQSCWAPESTLLAELKICLSACGKLIGERIELVEEMTPTEMEMVNNICHSISKWNENAPSQYKVIVKDFLFNIPELTKVIQLGMGLPTERKMASMSSNDDLEGAPSAATRTVNTMCALVKMLHI